VVVLDVHAGFDRTEALTLLLDLEVKLEELNPGAAAEVTNHISAQGATLSDLSEALIRLLHLGEGKPTSTLSSEGSRSPSGATAANAVLQWDPGSPDRLLLGATKDLAERLASETGRTLQWHDPLEEEVGNSQSGALAETSRSSAPFFEMSKIRKLQRPLDAKAAAGGTESALSAAGEAASWSRWQWPCSSRSCCASRQHVLTRVGSNGVGDHAYGLFVSYSRQEASAHARLFASLFERQMRHPVFLDATDAFDLEQILSDGVGRARALVLIQTQSVLRRPWVLLELFHALQLRRPIVCISIRGGGYDFAEAKSFLESLEVELERDDPAALRELEARLTCQGETVGSLQRRLITAIPNMISVPFDPSGSSNHISAVVQETLERIEKVSQLMQHQSALFRLPDDNFLRTGSVGTAVTTIARRMSIALRGTRPSRGQSPGGRRSIDGGGATPRPQVQRADLRSTSSTKVGDIEMNMPY